MTKKTDDMTAYQRDWYREKRQSDPDYAALRKKRRLENYDKVREQERKSRAKHIEKHRNDSRERMKEYRKTDTYREVRHRHTLKKKYNLTVEAWDEMFRLQGDACAICKVAENGGKRWHTDHCHTSGVVRGILCSHCNLMLGHARDNAVVLRLAADYIENTNPER